MKLILTSIVVFLSLNSFAQSATELSREEKVVVMNTLRNFLPKGDFRGQIVGVGINPFTTHRCIGGVFENSEGRVNAYLEKNRHFNAADFFFDEGRAQSIASTGITIDHKVTQASMTPSKISFTAIQKEDGYSETLEIEKLKNNRALIQITYREANGDEYKYGCNLNLDNKKKD